MGVLIEGFKFWILASPFNWPTFCSPIGPGFSDVGEGGVLEPLAPSDFVGKSWENLEPVAKCWESPAVNSGKFWEILASFAGAPREEAGSVSHDSAACEG